MGMLIIENYNRQWLFVYLQLRIINVIEVHTKPLMGSGQSFYLLCMAVSRLLKRCLLSDSVHKYLWRAL